MAIKGTFDASPSEGIAKGTVVMMNDECQIVYAGPFKGAPNADGVTVLLHADDFARLQVHRKN